MTVHVHRILCAVARAPSSRHVIAAAAAFAQPCDAEVRVFHVIDDQPRVDGAPDADEVLYDVSALARGLPRRTRVSTAVTAGRVVDEIDLHARLVRADLLVLGYASDGAGSISPTATRVMARAACPVLAVREADTDGRPDQKTIREWICAVDSRPDSLAFAEHALALGARLDARVTLVRKSGEINASSGF